MGRRPMASISHCANSNSGSKAGQKKTCIHHRTKYKKSKGRKMTRKSRKPLRGRCRNKEAARAPTTSADSNKRGATQASHSLLLKKVHCREEPEGTTGAWKVAAAVAAVRTRNTSEA
ncbi:hypothetical protein H1C71_031363 [Ictidomys tridecemlineatus]|nr:hypothetical protein H1C71_031363 [Ictidomys tridecemlineatus]